MDAHDADPNYREVVVPRDELEKAIRDHAPEWEYVGMVDAHSRELPEHCVRILLRRKM
jgi:hypothetical protein